MRVPLRQGGPGAGALHGVPPARAPDLRRGDAAGAATRALVLLQLRRGRPHRRRVCVGAQAMLTAAEAQGNETLMRATTMPLVRADAPAVLPAAEAQGNEALMRAVTLPPSAHGRSR